MSAVFGVDEVDDLIFETLHGTAGTGDFTVEADLYGETVMIEVEDAGGLRLVSDAHPPLDLTEEAEEYLLGRLENLRERWENYLTRLSRNIPVEKLS